MIHADCKPTHNNLFEVRFSDPNESFGKKPYEMTASMAEINRILYLRNRNYLVTTVAKWLNQREHAIKDATVLQQLHQVKERFSGALRITSYYNVCAEIRKSTVFLISIAPPEKSRFYNHYQNNVLHVINHCQQVGIANN